MCNCLNVTNGKLCLICAKVHSKYLLSLKMWDIILVLVLYVRI